MNFRSERGQGAVVLALIAIGFIALLLFAMSANSRGMQDGAEVIGESVGDMIDGISASETYVWWKGSQTLTPNKHAVERHGADAWASVDCYNRNGAFHVVKTSFDGIHLLCRDDDGSIRDVILEQQGKSKKFDLKNAFTPQNGNLKDVLAWLGRKTGNAKFNMPQDATIIIDGVIP